MLFLFIVCVGGCWLIFKSVGDAIFGKSEKKDTYIDKSVHHHYYHYDNRSVNVDKETFKSLGK
ncbi:hypothetical protein [Flavobacterium sp. 102]|uniref:hypothetical protein n=1 Tax=Flavobacterium sp. 102 TaxID=2135623 RepID=UPI0011C350DD|nr:hypothetical protein [Flavobacterium sp. 102]